MSLIPPSPAPLPSVSARQGMDPSTAQPLSPSSEPQAEYSDEIQKKIDIAKGLGLRRDKPNTDGESGEQITLRGPNGVPIECKYCLANPCHGMCWIFEGTVRFKCDACGRKQRLGITSEVADKTAVEFEGMDRAEVNRRRMWREQEVKEAEDLNRDLDTMGQAKENTMFKDRGFVESNFLS